MAESIKHLNLVKQIKEYIIKKYEIEESLIKIDIIGDGTNILPTGYKPDMYYEYNNQVIIGEAKTSLDVDREHSINQYKSFMKYCESNGENSVFILNTPWMDTIGVCRIIKKIKKENNYNFKIIILNDLGKERNI